MPTEDEDEGEGVQEGVRLDEEAPEPRSVMGFIGQSIYYCLYVKLCSAVPFSRLLLSEVSIYTFLS